MRRQLVGQLLLCLGVAWGICISPAMAEEGQTEPPGSEAPATEAPATEAASTPAAPQPWSSEWVTSVAVSPDGVTCFAATAQGLLLREADVVSLAMGDLSAPSALYQHPASVWSVLATPSHVISSDYQGNLATYDRAGQMVTMHVGALEKWTRALALAPDGQHVLAGNELGKLFAWSLEQSAVAKTLEVDAQQIYAIAVSPAGNQLAVADGAGHVHLVSWPEFQAVRAIELGTQAIWDVTYTADGSVLIAAGADQKVWRVGIEEGAQPQELATTSDWVSALALVADGTEVMIASLGGKVQTLPVGGGNAEAVADLPAGVWDLQPDNGSTILAGMRKRSVASLGRAWSVRYLQPDAVEAKE